MADTPLVGIKSVEDLRAYRFASAAELGLDTINQVMQRDLALVNAQMNDAIGLLASPLTEQTRIYGTSYKLAMQEVDEHGVPDSKKAQPGVTVGFPLRRFAITLGWTRAAMQRMTPAEMAEDYIAARQGYAAEVNKQIKKSAYLKTNYNFTDELTNGVTYGVKRFLNADNAKIPDYDGTSFTASSHQHYSGITGSAVSAGEVDALVSNVTEHGNHAGVMIAVHSSDEATIKALSGFKTAQDLGLIIPTPTTQTFTREGITDFLSNNRFIGFWQNSSVAVWVKPWAVDNRWACFGTGSPEKPLGYRRPAFDGLQGLRFESNEERLAVIAQLIVAEFGFGVWNRTAGAFLDIATGSGTYTDPTIS
jgi:hypothetical protein